MYQAHSDLMLLGVKSHALRGHLGRRELGNKAIDLQPMAIYLIVHVYVEIHFTHEMPLQTEIPPSVWKCIPNVEFQLQETYI